MASTEQSAEIPLAEVAADVISETVAKSRPDLESLPPLLADWSFWGMTTTQFLGAFNDSVFKQIVLLLCVKVIVAPGDSAVDLQSVAAAVFAVPFVLFSGTAGYWADRISKRTIIRGCKVAEVAIMLGGMGAFTLLAHTVTHDGTHGVPWLLWVVLFFMGTHSAVFGPAKYGILPEMVRKRDLPAFNGAIQMTTFVALILGTALAGSLVFRLEGALWIAGGVCAAIAVAGTISSIAIRRTPIAQPNARFDWAQVAVSGETWKLLKSDRPLSMALGVYSLFWFVAAIVPLSANALGRKQLELNEEDTSLMLACVAIGIAVGCVMAAVLSGDKVRFGFVRIGAWGIFGSLTLLALPGFGSPHLLGYRGSQATLAVAGVFVGLLAVPLQVFLQARPPETQRGRIIGTMNLINWIGIIASAGFYSLVNGLLEWLRMPVSCTFAASALMLLPVALFYHPRDTSLA